MLWNDCILKYRCLNITFNWLLTLWGLLCQRRTVYCIIQHRLWRERIWFTCIVLGQVLVFILFLLFAKPRTTGLLLLLGLLHSNTRHTPVNTTRRTREAVWRSEPMLAQQANLQGCHFVTHHSCSSGEGIRPAVPFLVFSSFPCHQLWSSLEIIWMTSPTLKQTPASLQGMRSSFVGSYSNWART